MYVCPMHPEVKSDKAGNCPECGMRLVKQSETKAEGEEKASYLPLYIIIGLILLVTIVLSYSDSLTSPFSLRTSMTYFMAGFFLVFSGFKLLDLKGFAQGYSSYDLFAQKVYHYGYIYPFLELGLGLGYILMPENTLLNLVTLVLMSFSGLGVLISMLQKRKFQCACLGTFIKVPLTKITLIEDFGMAVMALLMLYLALGVTSVIT